MWYHLTYTMFKELLLAVILGALLGFGITGGVIALKNNKNPASTLPKIAALPTISGTNSGLTQPTQNPSNTSTGTENHQITIESPGNESIVTDSKVTIKGSTSPLSSLIVSTQSKSYLSSADNAGNFNVDIDIDSGVNQIQIDAIDLEDNQSTTNLIITYSTAKI